MHWRITSQPPGARVVRSSDGVLLGTTPWQTDLTAGAEQTRVLLQLPGFAEQSLDLGHSADVDRNAQLQPVPPPEPKKRLKRKGAATGSKSSKSSSEDPSDDELRIVK